MRSTRGAAWPRMAAVVAAALGVVVAMLIVGNVVGGDDEGSDSATDPASRTPPPPPVCPDAPTEGESDPIDELDPDAPDAVPSGATLVRLCQGPGTELPDAGTLVTDDVERLATAINGLEQRAEKPEMCTMDIGPGYRMVFGYADGSTFTVSGRTYACRELVVGSAYRIPATEALAVFRELAG